MQYPIAIYQQNNAYHVTVPDIESLCVVDSSMAGSVSNTRMAVMANFFKFNQALIASILFRFFIRFFIKVILWQSMLSSINVIYKSNSNNLKPFGRL